MFEFFVCVTPDSIVSKARGSDPEMPYAFDDRYYIEDLDRKLTPKTKV